MKNLIFIMVAFLSCISINKSQAEVLFNFNEGKSEILEYHHNFLAKNQNLENNYCLIIDDVKKPWWLALISVDIQFGKNYSNCQCCGDGICRIRVNRSSAPNFQTVEELAEYLNRTNEYIIAINDKKEVFLLAAGSSNQKELNAGFVLDYLPKMDDKVVYELEKNGVNFKNLKLKYKYVPTITEDGYAMIKLN